MITINKNISIAGISFSIEDSAYTLLKRYLDSLDRYYRDHSLVDSMAEVEQRLSVIFAEYQGRNISITNQEVRRAISIVGHPAGVFDCDSQPVGNKPQGVQPKSVVSEFVSILVSILVIGFKIFVGFIAVVIGLLILGLIISSGIALTSGLSLVDFYLTFEPTLTVIIGSLAVIIPLLLLVYLICKLIFGFGYSKVIIISLSAITLVSWGFMGVSITQEVTNRAASYSLVDSESYQITGQTLRIEMEPKEVVKDDLQFLLHQYNGITNVDIEEDRSLNDSSIVVEAIRYSRGATTEKANAEAAKIEYQYNYSSNVLTLPKFIKIPTKDNKFYAQDLKIKISVPKGVVVDMPEENHWQINYKEKKKKKNK